MEIFQGFWNGDITPQRLYMMYMPRFLNGALYINSQRCHAVAAMDLLQLPQPPLRVERACGVSGRRTGSLQGDGVAVRDNWGACLPFSRNLLGLRWIAMRQDGPCACSDFRAMQLGGSMANAAASIKVPKEWSRFPSNCVLSKQADQQSVKQGSSFKGFFLHHATRNVWSITSNSDGQSSTLNQLVIKIWSND